MLNQSNDCICKQVVQREYGSISARKRRCPNYPVSVCCKIAYSIDRITLCTRSAQYYVASAFDKLLQTSLLIRARVTHTDESDSAALHCKRSTKVIAPRLNYCFSGNIERVEHGSYERCFAYTSITPYTDCSFYDS